MTFDAKSLLKQTSAPTVAVSEEMTVDALAAKLDSIKAMGLGQTKVKLPGGEGVNAIDLVAAGTVPAHFVVKHK